MAKQKFTFRCFQDEADYALMHSILMESAKADQVVETTTLDDIRGWCAPSERFDPKQDILFALGDKGTEIGFSRVSWYTGKDSVKLYTQASFLLPEHRKPGVWSEMVKENEGRLREIAAKYPDHQRFLQSWATEIQKEWISVLENEGFQAVRHFNNMLHSLEHLPDPKLPDGIEVRPVQEVHYRKIWEAQKEVQRELFEFVAEQWSDDKYQSWLKNPSHTPHLWQIAWDGDQVAGMVLGRIDAAENQALNRKRGYTEHVFVRKPWRQCGIAKALIARSLRELKEQGMEEAELGVDTENESGAYEFYRRMGYLTFSTDIWFRKPMELKTSAT
jgi:mycothiol synthase